MSPLTAAMVYFLVAFAGQTKSPVNFYYEQIFSVKRAQQQILKRSEANEYDIVLPTILKCNLWEICHGYRRSAEFQSTPKMSLVGDEKQRLLTDETINFNLQLLKNKHIQSRTPQS